MNKVQELTGSIRCTSCGAMISTGKHVQRLVLKPFHVNCQPKDPLSLQKFETDLAELQIKHDQLEAELVRAKQRLCEVKKALL